MVITYRWQAVQFSKISLWLRDNQIRLRNFGVTNNAVSTYIMC